MFSTAVLYLQIMPQNKPPCSQPPRLVDILHAIWRRWRHSAPSIRFRPYSALNVPTNKKKEREAEKGAGKGFSTRKITRQVRK